MTNEKCYENLLINIAKLAISDYRHYVRQYIKISRAEKTPEHRCALYAIHRKMNEIENWFRADEYSVFGRMGAIIFFIRDKFGFVESEEMSRDEYREYMSAKYAIEDKEKAKRKARVKQYTTLPK